MAKQHYCFLERFNNYFNRKIIMFNSLEDYENNSKSFFIPSNADEIPTSFDFNPDDNVRTEVINNDVPFDPDYFLLLDEEMEIVQRWFVIEQKRTRNGQWIYSLKRDVVADYFDTLRFAPIYVEKGHLEDDDPMILNDEGLRFNQIKKGETLLKDSSNTPWIIGYFENSASANNVLGTQQTAPSDYTTLSAIATAIGGNMTESDLVSAINGELQFSKNNIYNIVFGITTTGLNTQKVTIKGNSQLNFTNRDREYAFAWEHKIGGIVDWEANNAIEKTITYLNGHTSDLLSNTQLLNNNVKYFSKSQYDTLRNYVGKTILYGGKYYQINLAETNTFSNDLTAPVTNSFFKNVQIAGEWTQQYDDGEFYLIFETVGVQILLTEIVTDQLKLNLSGTHNILQDAPYSMFAIPLNSVQWADGGGYVTGVGGDAILDIVNALAIALGSKLYDLQLLPYAPLNLGIDWWDTDEWTINVDYDRIEHSNDNTLASIIFYPKKSNFNLSINANLSLKTSMKVDSQCRFYRLCSPNYNGVFEFNLAKNGGYVNYFNVDCTYKPFTPYIRVAPQFNLLYGANFGDGRGLILGGDFSLPIMTDQWINYQINNKNFASIFARDIQNLEFTQKQESIIEGVQAVTGTVTGTVGGAVGGLVTTGSPYGAIAGAVAGFGTSLAGGVADVAMGSERRAEQKDYMRDRFYYSLANIKALPDSIAKNSSFTINNKLYPFLEFYDCTEQEEQALINKIQYDGMTVNRIGNIEQFKKDTPHYFKGQLIRNDEIADDLHMLNAIYEELLKGVYI